MKLKPILSSIFPALILAPTIAAAQLGPRGHLQPGGLLASNATIEADQMSLDDAFRQLRNDVRAGNTSSVAADQVAITAAFAKLQADRIALMAALATNSAVQPAKATVQADESTIAADRNQLRSDEIVGDRTAIAADEQKLATDEATLKADLKTLKAAIAGLSQ